MIDDRARVLLKTLIERYIAEGEPIGSRTLSKFSGLDLSPASIRNVMADLEELGYIASPHTSAGRVPTPRGYRYFVDTLLKVQPTDHMAEKRQIEEQLLPGSPQQTINQAAQLLSELTRFAGVVMTPRRAAAFKQIEFVRLSDKRVLLILVTPEGDVQNRVLVTEQTFSPSQLVEAANFINQQYAGLDFETIKSRLFSEMKQVRQDIVSLTQAALVASNEALQENAESYVVSGERNLLDVQELTSNVSSLKRLFEILEKKTALLHLMDQCSKAHGVQIFIGGESEVMPLDEMSLVITPYEVDGRVVGTLGVIGPTRMAYERVIPIVDVTAKMLSTALSQN